MSRIIHSLAHRIGNAAEFLSRSDAPVDIDGATPAPSFLKQSLDDIHEQIVKGKPFSIEDIPAYVDALKTVTGVVGIDDRKLFLERLLVLMSRLPDDSLFSRVVQNALIDILYNDLPHPPSTFLPTLVGPKKRDTSYEPISTSSSTNGTAEPHRIGNGHANGSLNGSAHPAQSPYNPRRSSVQAMPYAARSADGSNNNPNLPLLGQARRPYARTVSALTPHSAQSLPDAGLLFDTLLKRSHSNSKYLPKTDKSGFASHPGGFNGFFFAFANLVIHSCFHTNHEDWSINDTSSYLDLSPLYGNDEATLKKVRRLDGTGRLWEDVFADGRVLFMPPSVGALLVLFCRNHNYIASKLLAINEWGTYNPVSDLSEEERKRQDEELFQRTRLVNCGHFIQIILHDYLGAILGLVRDGIAWRVDPLTDIRDFSRALTPRGEGNVVSIEFNLLYRWHATLSKEDTRWTEDMFARMFGTRDFDKITIEEFQRVAGQYMRPDRDLKKWTIDGPNGTPLVRDPETGGFRSADLAAILQTATESTASAFKARGIPEVLRVVEMMGIQQARSWGACTLNEFRTFFGLRPYSNFREWNPDPSIHNAAEALYQHIDNLELYVGMQAEETKPFVLGQALCPGFTIARAILADAISLTRGDRFFTTEFTTYNLTSWGYRDCFPDHNDGSFGGMMTKLLFRTLPDYYPSGSAYAHFPFIVPECMHEFLANLRESPVNMYVYKRPPIPAPTVVVRSYAGVKVVLEDREAFGSDVDARIRILTKKGFDVKLVNDVLTEPAMMKSLKERMGNIITQLIRDKSFEQPGSNMKFVDIVHDVVNMLPVHFVSTQLAGIPLKTNATPRGVYRESEVFWMFADICNFVFLNNDPGQTWVLRERALEAADIIIGSIRQHLKALSGLSIISEVKDSFLHWLTNQNNSSDDFFRRVLAAGKGRSTRVLANSIFASIVSSAALYAKSIAHVVDFYLQEHAGARSAIDEWVGGKSDDADAALLKFAKEALRLNPPVPTITRTAKRSVILPDGNTADKGQSVFCSIAQANLDTSIFGPDPSVPDYENGHPGLLGLDDYGLINSTFFDNTVPHVLRALLSLEDMERVNGDAGRLPKVIVEQHGLPEVAYVDFKSEVIPWPISLKISYRL